MSKRRIGVIYGGPSEEHEISVMSGKAVIKHLDRSKYGVIEVFIDKSNRWKIDGEILDQEEGLEQLGKRIDFALLALHGTFGEDGQIQKLLEQKGILYSGSGSTASKLAMDKHRASAVYRQHSLLVPEEVIITKETYTRGSSFKLPVVVKPSAQGSSVGVAIVKTQTELEAALVEAFNHDETVLVQEYIEGREVSCSVIEDSSGELEALPPTELIPVSATFFDYAAKYTPGATREITPPKMPRDMILAIQSLAKRAHEVLGCAGYSRTDMIVRNEDIYLIETNTLPGMTQTSIMPQQAEVAGINFASLLDRIISAGLHTNHV